MIAATVSSDAPITAPELHRILAQSCRDAGGQAAWARRRGFSAAYVSDLVNGKREVTEAVANSLGYVRQVRFVPIRKVRA